MDRRYGRAKWGPNGTRPVTSAENWRKPLRWDADAFNARERRRVFCASLADVFEDREDLAPLRDRLFGMVAMTRHLDWLMLTKRPHVASRYFRRENHWGAAGAYRDLVYGPDADLGDGLADWPPRNVWLGVSVEDQRRADERIPVLLDIPARVRFLSVEPLLGSVWFPTLKGIDWVIVGGESGHNARRCDIDWIRSIVKQCKSANVPCFVKQVGAKPFDSTFVQRADRALTCKDPVLMGPTYQGGKIIDPAQRWEFYFEDKKGGDLREWPEDIRVREFPR